MAVSDLTLRLLLLFFPGLICHFVIEHLTVHRERKPYEVFLFAYVYGVFSYVLYFLILCFCGASLTSDAGLRIPPQDVTFANALLHTNVDLSFLEIAKVTSIAVLVGIVFSTISTYKLLHRLARWAGITRKFGELDVWGFAVSTQARWVVLRDLENNLMYQGYLDTFSDDIDNGIQLILTQAAVYNETTGELLYEAPLVYLARKRDCLTIEFQDNP